MRALLVVAIVGMFTASTVAQPPEGDRGGRDERGRFFGPPPNVMFAAIDTDGDGVITKAELRKAVAALKQLDTDGDGNITLAEVTPASPFGDPAQFVDRIIAENDQNGDGKLSANEVPEPMQRMLEDADQNGDGEFTREELTAAMENMRNRVRGGRGGIRGGRQSPDGGDRDTDPAARIMQWDVDGNGLSADEIPPRMQGLFQPSDDKDKNGVLDAAEIQAVVARLGDRARGIGAGGDPNTFRDPNRRDR